MSENQIQDCPNCGAKLKSGIFSETKLFNEEQVSAINKFVPGQSSKNYCNSCGSKLLTQAKSNVGELLSTQQSRLKELLPILPVVSTHSPYNWEYMVLCMVSGQSTTGTGVLSDFKSSFTDLFGVQSGAYNKKLKEGENICYSQLRLQALNAGGNAIIAADIDYSEVGGDKGMLMVCMAGTAVKLQNLGVLEAKLANQLEELHKLNEEVNNLTSIMELQG